MSCKVKKITCLSSNHCFRLKYESSMDNIPFFSEKAIWYESGEKYAQIKHCLQFKVDLDVRGQHILVRSDGLMWKLLNDGFVWMQFLASQDINWWTGEVWIIVCIVFIICLDSHSDGTHSLQSIHWWASDAMLHFSKSDEETNSSTSWMTWGFPANVHFWVNYSFKLHLSCP